MSDQPHPGRNGAPSIDWQSRRPFLTAEWRWLLMLSWPIDDRMLAPLVPPGCELDRFAGQTYISMVGFMFFDTRIWQIPIPGHRSFEEVNLRFYVRRHSNGEMRRGVVFIKEIVPRRAVTWVARCLYHENYTTLPMRHQPSFRSQQLQPGTSVSYQWKFRGRWHRLAAIAADRPSPAVAGSLDRFIAEHYWGHTRHRRGTIEYRVSHPDWQLAPSTQVQFDCQVAELYGRQYTCCAQPPASAFIADGSAVQVYAGRRLAAAR